jgi:hypothetical protein
MARLPHIPLVMHLVKSVNNTSPCAPIPTASVTLAHEHLADNVHIAMHQVLHRYQRFDTPVTARDCGVGVLQLIQETITDDLIHADDAPSTMFHVNDAVNRTLWHLRTCHPNPARLVHLSNISKGMPRITYPQDLEKCFECLVAKMRKAARGYDPAFEATYIGQGLDMDVGFMFQRSKNAERAEALQGLNSGNAYCILYDFLTELLFGLTMKGKTIPMIWLNILLTRIAPPSTITHRIVRMDLGEKIGQNPEVNALFTHHGYLRQTTGMLIPLTVRLHGRCTEGEPVNQHYCENHCGANTP